MALIDPPLFLQTDPHPARSFRALITETWDEGVMDLTAFKVTQDAGGASFFVDVSAGRAVIQGDSATFQGNYMVTNDAAITDTVTITSAPVSNSRYDLVVLEVKDSTEDGGGSNLPQIRVIAGTPAASPAVPATPNTAIPLAQIGPITPSTTTITTSLITDVRPLAGRRDSPGVLATIAGTTIPTGWLDCDGTAVSRTTYARLFAEIGTAYGVGNGTTTFNLPDLRGKIPVARLSTQAQVDTIGETGGEYTHTMTTGELVAHAHGGVVSTEGGTNQVSGTPQVGGGDVNYTITVRGNSNASTGGGTAFNVMQPYQVVARTIIRT